jgi:hypothetical protein
LSDNWTDFVSADPWFRPEPARFEQAVAYLRGELASSGEIAVRDGEAVRLFFSPSGGLAARCPRCGAELSEQAIVDWLNSDCDSAGAFRLAPRAMACCGSQVSLHELTGEPRFAFARFGVRIMNPEWKFQETLPSRRAVDEMARNPGWIRAAEGDWLARHARWIGELRAGEREIAARLAPILGCEIVIVYEHF